MRIASALALGFVLSIPLMAVAQQDRSSWHKSLASAKAEAKKSGKPILLEFR
ncbi:MAG: hypothetical protein V3W41_02750 [Planctomycetota bacterium]